MKRRDERGESLLEVLAAAALAAAVSLMVVRLVTASELTEGRQRERIAVMMEARNIRERLVRNIQSSGCVEVTEKPDALILSMDEETVYFEKNTGLLSFGEGKAAKAAVRDMKVWKEKETVWFELIFECLEEGSYEVRGAACPRRSGGR